MFCYEQHLLLPNPSLLLLCPLYSAKAAKEGEPQAAKRKAKRKSPVKKAKEDVLAAEGAAAATATGGDLPADTEESPGKKYVTLVSLTRPVLCQHAVSHSSYSPCSYSLFFPLS